MENIRNADGIGEKELLVISFGTSHNDNRSRSIGAVEDALDKAYGSEWSIRRAFTSKMILRSLEKRDGIVIDTVEKALTRAEENGVKKLVIQPTLVMDGIEYDDIVATVKEKINSFESLAMGAPLLASDNDFSQLASILIEEMKQYDDGKTAICFMGHGTNAESNVVYSKLQKVFFAMDKMNYLVGTVEAEPELDDILSVVKSGDFNRVVLSPLMIVAGDHANNDMAGDEDDSWKSVFEKEGYEVICVIRGLGEIKAVHDMFIEHAGKALKKAL